MRLERHYCRQSPIFRGLALGSGLALLGTICLIWSTAASIIHQFPASEQKMLLGRRAISWFFGAYLEILMKLRWLSIHYEGFEDLPRNEACLLAPNHPSLLDAVLILSHFPEACCVLKSSLLKNPLFRGGAKLAGYISNRHTRSMIQQATQEICSGHPVLMFPEGTRSESGNLSELKLSPFMIATRANCDVQTILIDVESNFLGKKWSMLSIPKLPVRIRVRLGRRFSSGQGARDLAAEIEQYYRTRLAQNI